MTDQPWDVIIAGQGLAGTTLAWHLVEAGQRVLLVDAEEAVTSSKIAAGLITPITGLRMALSWRVDELLPVAQAFYTRIEALTGETFFAARRAVRLFKSDADRAAWSKRSTQPDFQHYVPEPQPLPLLDPSVADTSFGGFEMRAAQLDVGRYLEVSRKHLAYAPMRIDWLRDVTFAADRICVQGHTAKRLISCEGYAAKQNPHFSWVPFNAAKGDILTVRFDRPLPPVSLHRGAWLAPTAEPDVFRAGSTYDVQSLDTVPGAAARAEIESKLAGFLRLPYTVIKHEAAVRPVIRESQPIAGLHPQLRGLGYFNGLGSKGSLLAPWAAHCFAQHLVDGIALPDSIDLMKFV